MKKAKINKVNKNEKDIVIEDNSYSMKSFLKLVIIVVIVFLAFYFITTLVVKPLSNNKDNEVTVIDSQKITINQLLNRSDDEYYVLATKESLYNSYASKMNYLELYNKYINDYLTNEQHLPVYKIDLDDAFNKNYISDELNITNDLSNLKINDEVLFKIKNGSIEVYYVGSESILEALSSL